MLLSEIATAGKIGQFRTPRHIIKLMAELVAPQLGQRIADNDLPDIVQRFKQRDARKDADRKQKYFMVPKKELLNNSYDLNLSIYKEEVSEEVSYEKPNVIFGKPESIEATIQKALAELK